MNKNASREARRNTRRMLRVLLVTCLCAGMLALTLTACAGSEHASPPPSSSSNTSAESTQSAAHPTQESSETTDTAESYHTAATDEQDPVPTEEDSAQTTDVEQPAAPNNASVRTPPSSSPSGSSSSGSSNSNDSRSPANSSQSQSAPSTTTRPPSTNNTPSTQTPAPQTIAVTIEVSARAAHAADPAAVAGLSVNGVILSRTALTLPADATVRDALDATGVRLNARGAYIAGIGGLNERDLGPRSGWVYSVNGQFPAMSASARRLSAGDTIVWHYTVDGGGDVGAPGW